MLNSREVADILELPILAIGQLVFESKLIPTVVDDEFMFKETDVNYIRTLDLSQYK